MPGSNKDKIVFGGVVVLGTATCIGLNLLWIYLAASIVAKAFGL